MHKERNAFKFITWGPALNLIAGGALIIVAFLLSDIPKMIASQGWPATDGTILHHRFSGVKFKEYDGDFYTKIDVVIRYEYSVDGVSYTSLSINSIDTIFCPSSYASRFPVGEDVTVYYNPKDPADAVLEPGLVNVLKAFGRSSFFFLLVGISLLFLGISEKKRTRDRNLQKKSMEKYLAE